MRRLASLGALLFACSPAGRGSSVAPTEPPLDIPPLHDAAAAPADDEGTVRFRRAPPTVGARWIVSTHAESRTADPASGPEISAYTSEYEVLILAVSGPAPSRVRLHFDTNVHSYRGAEKPTVLNGRSYVVDTNAPYVHGEGDAAVSEEERERVLDVFPDLGTRTRIDEVLPDDAMHVGQKRDDLAAAILRVIHPRAWTLAAGQATLARAAGDEAVFTVSLDATSGSGIRMKVEGEARVRLRDARLTGLALDGTYGHASSSTAGSFTLRRTVRDVR